MPFWVTFGVGVGCYIGFEWLHRSYVPVTGDRVLFFSTSIYAPAALAFFVALAVTGFIHRSRRARMLDHQTGLDSLRHLSEKDFEFLVAEMFRREGHVVDYELGAGADGGVDVTLKKGDRTILVQCKRWKNEAVGVSTVREMFGVLHHRKADEAVILTTSSFTLDAREFAKGKPIGLVDGPTLWRMVNKVRTSEDDPKARHAPEVKAVNPPSAPACCPRCHGAMFKTKRRDGTPFWGCTRYPHCTGSRSLLDSRRSDGDELMPA